jgi:hypothetical protein
MARHLVDDAQIALTQLMGRLWKLGVDDDDVDVWIVDHQLDRLHVDGGIDHRRETGVERIADDRARSEHLSQLAADMRAERRKIQALCIESIDQHAALAA